MRQQVEVKSVGADGYAQVEAVRRSACSGDCDHCGGCASAKQHVLVRAKNPIGAAVGDQVIVETRSRAILGAAQQQGCQARAKAARAALIGNGVPQLPVVEQDAEIRRQVHRVAAELAAAAGHMGGAVAFFMLPCRLRGAEEQIEKRHIIADQKPGGKAAALAQSAAQAAVGGAVAVIVPDQEGIPPGADIAEHA